LSCWRAHTPTIGPARDWSAKAFISTEATSCGPAANSTRCAWWNQKINLLEIILTIRHRNGVDVLVYFNFDDFAIGEVHTVNYQRTIIDAGRAGTSIRVGKANQASFHSHGKVIEITGSNLISSPRQNDIAI
jgi:hypothetical protein